MAGWHDVIDTMIGLKMWWLSDVGARYGDGFMASKREQMIELTGVDPKARGDEDMEPGWLAYHSALNVAQAEPFYVSEDAFELIDGAACKLDPEPLQRTDLITHSGFALLPRPFYSRDRNGKRINTRAFSWGPVRYENQSEREAALLGAGERSPMGEAAPGVGTMVILYSSVLDDDDFTTSHQDDAPFSREVLRGIHALAGGLSLWHFTPWFFGQPVPNTIQEMGVAVPGEPTMWTWIQSFFRLSMQQLLTANYSIPPRAYARRARRAGRDPGVLVMRLRRTSQPKFGDNGDEGPDWKYRWITRGHWRNQWYPSLGVHRQIWISPYIKGPENKPLKQPDLRVFTFNR